MRNRGGAASSVQSCDHTSASWYEQDEKQAKPSMDHVLGDWRRRAIDQLHNFKDRETTIATVSRLIQSSPKAWRNCFKTLAFLVLGHVFVQAWFAFPFSSSLEPNVTQWHTCRKLYLAQIGVVSLGAMVSLHVQVRGLIGTQGIIPFPRHAADRIKRFPPKTELLSWNLVQQNPFRWLVQCMNVLESRWWERGCTATQDRPDDWWRKEELGLTDAKLSGLCYVGETASAAVIVLSLCDGALGGGFWASILELLLGIVRVLALLGATGCYRALRVAGTVFTALQWDSLVQEANMLAVPLALPFLPNCWLPFLLLAQQVCAFKNIFGAGVVKRRSKCPRWADSTAMDLHYETQPLPHIVSWYMHKLPQWMHVQECWVAFLIQLPLAFLQWGPWPFRLCAFLGYAALMTAIMCTGNYGFFNLQVLGLAVSMLDDSLLPFSLSTPCDPLPRVLAVLLLPGVAVVGVGLAAACGMCLLDLPRLSNAAPQPKEGSWPGRALALAQKAHDSLRVLGIGHSYGPFAAMTTFRWELIFEVTTDGTTWTQLEFPNKPGCIDTRPQWMPVFHFARLDWRLWFVPLGMSRGCRELPEWVQSFILQLLKGSGPVAKLTRHPESLIKTPPVSVRVSVWDYHFSSCDPSVHQCPAQVTLTGAERDAAYDQPANWLGVPTAKATRSVVLDRSSGEALGFTVQRIEEISVVRVAVPGGLLGQWNTSHMGDRIEDGDALLQVNGINDTEGMLAEFEKDAVLTCEFRLAPRQRTTEWGRWWYRRLVSRLGVYSLGQGQTLQCRSEN